MTQFNVSGKINNIYLRGFPKKDARARFFKKNIPDLLLSDDKEGN